MQQYVSMRAWSGINREGVIRTICNIVPGLDCVPKDKIIFFSPDEPLAVAFDEVLR